MFKQDRVTESIIREFFMDPIDSYLQKIYLQVQKYSNLYTVAIKLFTLTGVFFSICFFVPVSGISIVLGLSALIHGEWIDFLFKTVVSFYFLISIIYNYKILLSKPISFDVKKQKALLIKNVLDILFIVILSLIKRPENYSAQLLMNDFVSMSKNSIYIGVNFLTFASGFRQEKNTTQPSVHTLT